MALSCSVETRGLGPEDRVERVGELYAARSLKFSTSRSTCRSDLDQALIGGRRGRQHAPHPPVVGVLVAVDSLRLTSASTARLVAAREMPSRSATPLTESVSACSSSTSEPLQLGEGEIQLGHLARELRSRCPTTRSA